MDKLKYIVDAADAISQGWLCYCVHPCHADYIEQVVTEDELLGLLYADDNGGIPDPISFDNAEGEQVSVMRRLSLDQWLSEVGTQRLHFHLSEVINEREGRTQRQYIDNQPSAIAGLKERIEYLTSTIPHTKTGKAA